MNPHIEIRTDHPEELLKALDDYRAGFRPIQSRLLPLLKASQARLVETEHQGFANYETFCIGVMIDSDRQLLDLWLSLARRSLNAPSAERLKEFGVEGAAELDLADAFKDHYDLSSPEIPSPWNELCNAGLSRVDWLDLARHYISKVKEGVSV